MKNIFYLSCFSIPPSPYYTFQLSHHWITYFCNCLDLLYFFLWLLGCLSGLCFGLSLIYSPFVMYFCRKKSTRLTGVIGGNMLLFLKKFISKIFLTKFAFFSTQDWFCLWAYFLPPLPMNFINYFLAMELWSVSTIFFLILWQSECYMMSYLWRFYLLIGYVNKFLKSFL